MLKSLKERGLCLFRMKNVDQPIDFEIDSWSTIDDLKFGKEICSIHRWLNEKTKETVKSEKLPSLISYLWPLAQSNLNLWTVEHLPDEENEISTFVRNYDLLILNKIQSSKNFRTRNEISSLTPQILIFAPDWSSCESISKHLNEIENEFQLKIEIKTFYEAQNLDEEIEKRISTGRCDILIGTPTMIENFIENRKIHLEQIQLIIFDQIENFVETNNSLGKFFEHLNFQTKNVDNVQYLPFSRRFDRSTKNFLEEKFSKNRKEFFFFSSSFFESFSYRNFPLEMKICRNWFDRKEILREKFDFASRFKKKISICANEIRRLTTMQNILEDFSIQSVLIDSQLSKNQLESSINEWKTIDDRLVVLLIEDELLTELEEIEEIQILVHLDFQRSNCSKIIDQRSKLMFKFLNRQIQDENFFPTMIFLWPSDFGQISVETRQFFRFRIGSNENFYFSSENRFDAQFCPTLKSFGRCSNESNRKFCSFRHEFFPNIDSIEQNQNENFPIYFDLRGQIEIQITEIIDGNRFWAKILSSKKNFDFEKFQNEIEENFDKVRNQPLSEVVPGEIYFFQDEHRRVHRVLFKENQQKNVEKKFSSTLFSFETGKNFPFQQNLKLFPIENSTMKQFPMLVKEFVLCNVEPKDRVRFRFTPFLIETLRTLTLGKIFSTRIRLATVDCFWIDRLVESIRFKSLKLVVEDRPIREKLFQMNLIETNDFHIEILTKLAEKCQLEIFNESFVNRQEQKIVNPLGRSKEFFLEQKEKIPPPGPSNNSNKNFFGLEPSNPQSSNVEDGLTEVIQDRSKNLDNDDENDQMMFIFGPKLISQLEQIKRIEEERKLSASFSFQGNNNRRRTSNEKNYSKEKQRKTRIFWEQTAREIYLTIGFSRVDSKKTQIDFEKNSLFCQTTIRSIENFLRIELSEEILPEKSSFQIRRTNIFVTMRKFQEGKFWKNLTEKPIEPTTRNFSIEYGSDDESETEKQRRNAQHQWTLIRNEKKICQNEQIRENDKETDENQTETSSDSFSFDSDDCYYEDQVPSNHIPKGYHDQDFDHRFLTDSSTLLN